MELKSVLPESSKQKVQMYLQKIVIRKFQCILAREYIRNASVFQEDSKQESLMYFSKGVNKKYKCINS